MIAEGLDWNCNRHNKPETLTPTTEICSKVNFLEEQQPVVHITEDIIVEILSRLRADHAMRCQTVCKKWREIISMPFFAELQLERGAKTVPPSIFIHEHDQEFHVQKELDYRICDADQTYDNSFRGRRINSTKIRTEWFHHKLGNLKMIVSCSVDGLLAFHASNLRKQVFIMNPVIKEFLCLEFPFFILRPCGIFRDPISHDYKMLLVTSSERAPWFTSPFDYHVVTIKNMVTKKLKYSSCWRAIIATHMTYSNGSLHWFVGILSLPRGCDYIIMVFNTTTENFRVLPHPGDQKESTCRVQHKFQSELLETRGKLCFSEIYDLEMHVWVLEDHVNWAWEKRYTVNLNLDWCIPPPPIFKLVIPDSPSEGVTVVGINNTVELLIRVFKKGTFWYNLEKNTVRKTSILESDEPHICSWSLLFTVNYTKTLVRLQNQ